jgi:hypothetical protein
MPPSTLKTLPAESIAQLAQVLQHQPNEDSDAYGERVTHTVRHSSKLKHKCRLLTFLSVTTNAPSANMQASLCALHRTLSAPLVREIFTLLALEVGHNCNSLVRHNDWLKPTRNAAVARLRGLHALWMPEEPYRKTFGPAAVAPDPRWVAANQRSDCEGCVLTKIGSEIQIVTELRILLMSRRRTARPDKGQPRLLGVVNGWMIGLVGGSQRGQEMMRGSEMEGEELKIVRKRIWAERTEEKKRREARRRAKKEASSKVAALSDHMEEKTMTTTTTGGGGGGGGGMEKQRAVDMTHHGDVYDSDFEHDIIDHYAAPESTLVLSRDQVSAPVQTPSLTTGPSATTFSSCPDVDLDGEIDDEEDYEDVEYEDEDGDESLPSYPQASSVYSVRASVSAAAPYKPPRPGKAWIEQKTNTDTTAGTGPEAKEMAKAKTTRDRSGHAEMYRQLLTPSPEEDGVVDDVRRLDADPDKAMATPAPLFSSSTGPRPRRGTRWSEFCG